MGIFPAVSPLALLHFINKTELQMSGEKTVNEVFVEACKNGEDAKVNAAIVLGVNVNTKDATGLMWALANKHENIVDILLAHPDIDINGKDNAGVFPLSIAAGLGLTSVVAKLGRMPALRGVNDQGFNGSTPLSLATNGGHLSTVRELLKIPGIDINAAEKNGDTPLHFAAKKGNADVMAVLITVPGASLAVRNKAGKTAEQLARDGNHNSVLALIPGTVEQIQAEMSALKESIRNIQMGQGGARINVPECPVCFEVMAPPKQIFHCVNGHFVCGSCRPNIRMCPKCRNNMAGRAHDTEEMLRAGFSE